jgi:hypothetical protein
MNKLAAKGDEVLASFFDPYDFEHGLANLELVEKKLTLEARPARGRKKG